MTEATKELIAEARELGLNYGGGYQDYPGGPTHAYLGLELLEKLADALESATRVPVQGEPTDDREALARVLYIASDDFAFADRMAKAWDAPGPHGRQRWYRYADAVIAAGFSRATVPDAATGTFAEKLEREHGALAHERIIRGEVEEQRDAALAAVERVRAIHGPGDEFPAGCDYCERLTPCSTRAALDGAPEPEVEAEEEIYQAGCGSWDCRAPECGRASDDY